MLKAKKGNRVVRIPDEKKKEYIALGYTISDMKGKVIHEYVEPTEKLKELEKENKDLKQQVENLKTENADLKAKSEKSEEETPSKAPAKKTSAKKAATKDETEAE